MRVIGQPCIEINGHIFGGIMDGIWELHYGEKELPNPSFKYPTKC